MFKIFGMYNETIEELDEAETLQSASYLVWEYSQAYGPDWSIWFERE